MSIEEKVEGLIQKPIEDLGYLLYDIYYVKEGKDYFLRVMIDKENGIDLEDCEKVSNVINPILDEADYIKEQYFLEVSSPGIERVLRKERHFEQTIGKEVEITFFKKVNGEKTISGILEKNNLNSILIQRENTNQEIPKNEIAFIKTKYNWKG